MEIGGEKLCISRFIATLMKAVFILMTLAAVGFSSCNSCRRANEIEERREALKQNDRDELDEARRDLAAADSIASVYGSRMQKMEADSVIVFEKEDKYQDKGFYVLREHAGDKSKLEFFPELEEEGQLLLVRIDANRKWSFLKIAPVMSKDKSALERKEVLDFVGRSLTQDEVSQVVALSEYAYAMKQLRDATASQDKNRMKIEYYENKIGAQTNSID